jgi:hypothetical protein
MFSRRSARLSLSAILFLIYFFELSILCQPSFSSLSKNVSLDLIFGTLFINAVSQVVVYQTILVILGGLCLGSSGLCSLSHSISNLLQIICVWLVWTRPLLRIDSSYSLYVLTSTILDDKYRFISLSIVSMAEIILSYAFYLHLEQSWKLSLHQASHHLHIELHAHRPSLVYLFTMLTALLCILLSLYRLIIYEKYSYRIFYESSEKLVVFLKRNSSAMVDSYSLNKTISPSVALGIPPLPSPSRFPSPLSSPTRKSSASSVAVAMEEEMKDKEKYGSDNLALEYTTMLFGLKPHAWILSLRQQYVKKFSVQVIVACSLSTTAHDDDGRLQSGYACLDSIEIEVTKLQIWLLDQQQGILPAPKTAANDKKKPHLSLEEKIVLRSDYECRYRNKKIRLLYLVFVLNLLILLCFAYLIAEESRWITWSSSSLQLPVQLEAWLMRKDVDLPTICLGLAYLLLAFEALLNFILLI